MKDAEDRILRVNVNELIPIVKATKVADKNGTAIVVKDNRPLYKIINLDVESDIELTDDEKIAIAARRVLDRFKPAFLELAK